MQMLELTLKIAKYTQIRVSTVTENKGWCGDKKSHIIIGTPIQLSRLVERENLLNHVNLICFDDADLTVPFADVYDKVLNMATAKTMTITSSISEKIVNKFAQSEVFKVPRYGILNINVKHYMIVVSKEEKMQFLLSIIKAIPSHRIIIFCKVRFIFSIKFF